MEQRFGYFAVKTPFSDGVLTYQLDGTISYEVGHLYELPFRKKSVTGLFLGPATSAPNATFKILAAKDRVSEIAVTADQIALWRWMANYYHYPLGQLIWESLPKLLKRPRALKVQVGSGNDIPFVLNSDQQKVLEEIRLQIKAGKSKHLIHGVTGSGKTSIYLSLMKEVFEAGKSVLFLLPEINLTPQFVEVFTEYTKAAIYTYHSEISASDKYNLWCHLSQSKGPTLIIGVRSSIFLPFNNLGLIIVDEEHDQSFKQDDRCPYNARDIAIKRAQLEKFPVVLGSATPSLETFQSHKDGGTYHSLTKRAGDGELPTVTLIDETEGIDPEHYPLSQVALDKIQYRLKKGEQVLVFVNRLGFSNYLQCRSCGHRFECPNCSSNLRYFKSRNEVLCHICGYKGRSPDSCPECQNMQLLPKGYGTEKVEEVLRAQIPTARIDRFDRDEIKTFSMLKETLDRFHNHESDILVGTQMLSKGHNFKRVNLVVILGTDSQLNFPDFRAGERVYQLLTQVTGRSGRYGSESEVVIQSLSPESDIYTLVKDHSFNGFYANEIKYREMCEAFPYKRMIALYISSKSQSEIINASESLATFCRHLIHEHFQDVQLLGPRPALIEKRVNRFNWTLTLKGSDINQIHNCSRSIEKFLAGEWPKIEYKVDVDPYLIM